MKHISSLHTNLILQYFRYHYYFEELADRADLKRNNFIPKDNYRETCGASREYWIFAYSDYKEQKILRVISSEISCLQFGFVKIRRFF